MDFAEIQSGLEEYKKCRPQHAQKTYDLYGKMALPARVSSLLPSLSQKSKSRYIFAGNVSYFADLMEVIPVNDYAIFTSGIRTHLAARRAQKRSHLILSAYDGLQTKIDEPNADNRRIQSSIRKISMLLDKISAEILFIQSDAMPFERILLSAAKDAGVLGVCVQHGIFTRNTPKALTEGKFADVFLSYDHEQTKIVKEGSPGAKVICSGSFKKNSKKLVPEKDDRIIFLGQPYPLLFGSKKSERYLEIVKSFSAACQRNGLSLHYKPHPAELGSEYLKHFDNVVTGEIAEMFNEFSLFVGVSSTTLQQASLAGKVAVQIIDQKLHTERYQELGYCYSFDSSEVDLLCSTIKDLNAFESQTLELFERGTLESRWHSVKEKLHQIG